MNRTAGLGGCAASLYFAFCVGSVLLGCSAGSKPSGASQNPLPTPTGAGGNQLPPVGAGGFVTGISGTSASGGTPIFTPIEQGGAATGDGGMACPAIRQKPEVSTTYQPVALFIMQDRTGSMVSGVPSGCACSWMNSTTALNAFVNDPASAGLDVGLGFFGGMDKTVCDGSDCGQEVVPIAPIAMVAQPITSAMNSNAPNPLNITPLECGLRGMVNVCLKYMSTSPTGEKCVAVLVTDGNTMDPTPCDANVANLVAIVADGLSKGVKTFTLGLQGSDPNFLDQIARAGGTMAHIDASGGVTAFVNALNSIRSAITVSTPLPCTWKIPARPAGARFDPKKVNVEFTPPGGTAQSFGHVDSEADCARATGDAWYYDNSAKPLEATQVIACPNSCSGTLHNSIGAEVAVLFGCDTVPAPIR